MCIRSTVLLTLGGVVVGFVAAVLLLSGGVPTVSADCPGEPGAPCDNGDVNADGDLDITDAVYILQYLFLGGPAPRSISCPPGEPFVPATGQTSCYDTAGVVIDCDSAEYPGQDRSYQAGCSLDQRFVDNGDGTVTDLCTGLTWTQRPAEQPMSWREALQYCDSLILCEDDSFVNDPEDAEDHGDVKHDDWRLPNIKELASLHRYGDPWPASAFGPGFLLPVSDLQTMKDHFYWSSTTWSQPGNTQYAWVANYMGGVTAYVQQGLKTYSGGRVLAVRGGL